MKKILERGDILKYLRKTMRIMRLSLFLILISTAMAFSATSYSQNTKLTLNLNNATVKEVIKAIEDQSEFLFFYQEKHVDLNRQVTLHATNQDVETILNQLFAETNNIYVINDRQIVIGVAPRRELEKQMLRLKGDIRTVIEQPQQKEITGKVTDSDGLPLPGVSVIVKGTTIGTVTNNDGVFSLNIPLDTETLQFSFVGMKTQEIPVANQTIINVSMVVDAIGIEEVVAVGYGTMSRNKISTSVTSVEPEAIKSQLSNSLDRALEGQVAGMDIKQNSGAPGGGAVMRIRGSSSLQGNNAPLFVVDGVPMTGYSSERSPLALIDQNDIENIEVLKDVSATAIYGSRGSNGVILITTKSGKAGKTELSVNVKTGVSSRIASEKLDLMNAEQFARWRKENQYERAAFYNQDISIDDIPEAYQNPEFWRGKGTDWQDEMVRVAPHLRINFNVTHGTEKFTGYFSMGYTHDEGIVKHTNFKRLTMRANMDFSPNDYLKIGLNLNPTMRLWGNESQSSNPFDSRGTAIGTATMVPPTDGPYLDDYPNEQPEYFDGKWDINIHSPGTFNFDNPLYKLEKLVDDSQNFDIIAQPYLVITPLKDLVFRSQLNLQLGYRTNEYFKPSTIKNKFGGWGGLPPRPISGSYATGKSYNWQFENTLNYQKTFGLHDFDILAGYTMEHYNGYSSHTNGLDYPSDDIKTLNAATEWTASTSESNWSLISGIFRLNYNFDAKYLLTATIRRDGSSRFGEKNKWGYFPSVAIGWNVSKENFFPEFDWLSNFKLRASYGSSGNNNIGNYAWIPNMAEANYNTGGSLAIGKRVGSLANPYLGWEKAEELNTGLDLTLFNGKLDFIIDYYNKLTSGMLWDVSLPSSSGYGSIVENVGEIRNRGVEFTVSSENIRRNNFRWETDFNISFNRNKVMDLGRVNEITTQASHSGDALITRVGDPMGMFYGWVTAGVFMNEAETEQYATIPGGQLPGTVRWEDQNGDGIINVEDKVIIGNPHPDFRGGMNNRFYYKDFDFNVSLTYAYNFDVYASLQSTALNTDGVFNVLASVENRWRSPEEPGDGWQPATFHQTYLDRDLPQSKFVHNVSFVKVQNISMGYTFNDILRSVQQMRLSFTVQNPFLFTNYEFGNPDTDNTGLSARPNYHEYDYPLSRMFELGLNLVF